MAYSLLETRYTYYVDSGTTTGSALDIRGYGKAYYDQTSTDLINNQSRTKLEFGVQIKGSWYGKYKVTGTIYQKVNGSWNSIATKTYTSNEGTQSSGTYLKGTLTDKIIPHDSSGNAQFRVGVTITGISGVVGSKNYLYTYTLPAIAQTTECGDISLIVGQTTVYTINPKNSDYTHSLKLEIAGETKYVNGDGTISDSASSFSETTINIECPTSFYSLIAGTTRTGTATLTTYYVDNTQGSSSIIGSSTGVLTVSVGSDCIPRFLNVAFADINSTTLSLTGNNNYIIPNYSTVRITPTIKASATQDSGVSILTKKVDNVAFTGNYYDALVAKSDYTLYALNTRGLSNTQTFTVPHIVDYFTAFINASSNFDRPTPTSNTMRVNFSGTFWNNNFGAMANALSISWKVREKGSSTWTSGGTFVQGTDYTLTDNTFSSTSNLNLNCPLTGGWSYQKAYEFQIIAQDRLSTYTFTDYINKGEPMFYWYEKNDANYFKVNGTLQATNLKISNNGLLNLIYPIGSIYTTTDGTFNPNTTFGGTWQQIKDVFLLAAGDTYAGGSTGGSADLQAHTHTMAADFYIRHGNTNNTDIVAAGTNTTITNGAYSSTWGNGIYTSSYSHKPDKVAISGNTGSTGAGNQGNMPPYLTVYVWKRTA